MAFKLFANLINALSKVADGLKAIVNLPKVEQEAMSCRLDETYRLINTTFRLMETQQMEATT